MMKFSSLAKMVFIACLTMSCTTGGSLSFGGHKVKKGQPSADASVSRRMPVENKNILNSANNEEEQKIDVFYSKLESAEFASVYDHYKTNAHYDSKKLREKRRPVSFESNAKPDKLEPVVNDLLIDNLAPVVVNPAIKEEPREVQKPIIENPVIDNIEKSYQKEAPYHIEIKHAPLAPKKEETKKQAVSKEAKSAPVKHAKPVAKPAHPVALKPKAAPEAHSAPKPASIAPMLSPAPKPEPVVPAMPVPKAIEMPSVKPEVAIPQNNTPATPVVKDTRNDVTSDNEDKKEDSHKPSLPKLILPNNNNNEDKALPNIEDENKKDSNIPSVPPMPVPPSIPQPIPSGQMPIMPAPKLDDKSKENEPTLPVMPPLPSPAK